MRKPNWVSVPPSTSSTYTTPTVKSEPPPSVPVAMAAMKVRMKGSRQAKEMLRVISLRCSCGRLTRSFRGFFSGGSWAGADDTSRFAGEAPTLAAFSGLWISFIMAAEKKKLTASAVKAKA